MIYQPQRSVQDIAQSHSLPATHLLIMKLCMTAAPQVLNRLPRRNHTSRYWISTLHNRTAVIYMYSSLSNTTPAPTYRESHLSTILRPADGRRLICRRASWDSHRYIGLSETSDKLLLVPTTVIAPSKNQGTLRSMTESRRQLATAQNRDC